MKKKIIMLRYPIFVGCLICIAPDQIFSQGIVNPIYAKDFAGEDKYICSSNLNQAYVTIGPTKQNPYVCYFWTPTTGLDNPNVQNPKASPSLTTTYIFHQYSFAAGTCIYDSVTVFVNQIQDLTITPLHCFNPNHTLTVADFEIKIQPPDVTISTESFEFIPSKTFCPYNEYYNIQIIDVYHKCGNIASIYKPVSIYVANSEYSNPIPVCGFGLSTNAMSIAHTLWEKGLKYLFSAEWLEDFFKAAKHLEWCAPSFFPVVSAGTCSKHYECCEGDHLLTEIETIKYGVNLGVTVDCFIPYRQAPLGEHYIMPFGHWTNPVLWECLFIHADQSVPFELTSDDKDCDENPNNQDWLDVSLTTTMQIGRGYCSPGIPIMVTPGDIYNEVEYLTCTYTLAGAQVQLITSQVKFRCINVDVDFVYSNSVAFGAVTLEAKKWDIYKFSLFEQGAGAFQLSIRQDPVWGFNFDGNE